MKKCAFLFICLLSVSVFASETPDSTEMLRRFVEETPKVAIDNRTLLHVLGDTFGQGTELEGQFPNVFLKYNQQLIEMRQQVVGTTVSQADYVAVQHLLEKFPAAIELNNWVLADKNPLGFVEALKKHLDRLDVGEHFFLPAGWFRHAVVFEVIKQAQETFTFRVFNTGDGLQYHRQFSVGTKWQSLPIVELTDISEDRLTDVFFAAALQELMRVGKGAKDFYQKVLPFLEGKPSTVVYSTDSLGPPQTSGTCAYASLAAYYKEALGDPGLGRRLVFDIQAKALHDYFELHRDMLSSDVQSRNLARKCVTALAVSAKSVYDSGDIDETALRYIAESVHRYARILDSVDGEVDEQLNSYAQKLSELSKAGLNFPKIVDMRAPFAEPTAPGKYYSIEAISDTYDPITLNLESASLLDELRHIVAALEQSVTDERFDLIRTAVREIALALPLEVDNPVWTGLSASDALAVAGLLPDVSKAMLYASLATALTAKDPVDFIALIKLQAVAEMLIRHYDPELGETLPNLCPPKLCYFLSQFGTGHFLVPLFSPEWDEEVIKSRAFWPEETCDDSQDFFGFRKYHSDAGYDQSSSDQITSKYKAIVDGDSSEWLDVKWAGAWIGRPEVQEKLATHYPALLERSLNYQAVAALREGGEHGGETEEEEPNWRWTKDGLIVSLGASLTAAGRSILYREWEMAVSAAKALATGVNYLIEHALYRQDRMAYQVKEAFSPAVERRSALQILPENFFVLRDLAFYADVALHSYMYSPTAVFGKDRKDLSTSSYDEGVTFRAYYVLDPLDVAERNVKSGDPRTTPGHHWRARYYLFGLPVHVTRHHDMGKDGLAFMESRGHYSYLPNWHVSPGLTLYDEQDGWSLDREVSESYHREKYDLMRSMLNLSRVPELQAIEALGFYIAHPDYLEEFKHQTLLKKMLFQSAQFKHMLGGEPARSADFLLKAGAFCSSQFQNYLTMADAKTALFYLELSRYLQSYFTYYQRVMPEAFPPDFQPNFMDCLAELRKLKESGAFLGKEALLVDLELARSYQHQDTELDADSFVELFCAVVRSSGYNIDYSVGDYSYKALRERQMVLYTLRDDIERLMRSTEAESILAGIQHTLQPELKLTWQDVNRETFHPQYIGKGDQTVHVDLLKGIWYGVGEQKQLPAKFLESVLGKRVADKSTLSRDAGRSAYEFIGKDGQTYFLKVCASIYFQAEWWRNGYWYRLQMRPSTGPSYIGFGIDHIEDDAGYDLGVLEPLAADHEVWYSKAAHEVLFVDPESGKVKFRAAVHAPRELLNGEQVAFHLGDEDLVLDGFSVHPKHATDEHLMIDLITRGLTNPLIVRNVYQIADDGVTESGVLVDRSKVQELLVDKLAQVEGWLDAVLPPILHIRWPFHSDPDAVSRLESVSLSHNPHRVFDRLNHALSSRLWADVATGDLIEVEFPSLELGFHRDGANRDSRWVSEKFPGYQLADQQHLPILGRLVSYLLLDPTSGEGPSKVLMTHGEFERLASVSSLDPRMVKTSDERLMVFEISMKTGLLVPENVDSSFYLAMVYLWQHNYDLASHYLRYQRQFLASGDASNVFDARHWAHIFDSLFEMNKDSDPRAAAVRLLAYHCLLQHESTVAVQAALNRDYMIFLDNEGWVDEHLLSPIEELKLAQNIGSSNRIESRIRLLEEKLAGRNPGDLQDTLQPYGAVRPLVPHEVEKGALPSDQLDLTTGILSQVFVDRDESALSVVQDSFWGLMRRVGFSLKSDLLSPKSRPLPLFYKASRGELDLKEMRNAIEVLTEITRPPFQTHEEAARSWKDALLLRDQEPLIQALLVVQENVKLFPSTEELAEALRNTKKKDDDLASIFRGFMSRVFKESPDMQLSQRGSMSSSAPVVSSSKAPVERPELREIYESSVCASPDVAADHPLVEDIASLIETVAVDAGAGSEREALIEQLKELFVFAGADTMLTSETEKLRTQLTDFAQFGGRPEYRVVSLEELLEERKHLQQQFEHMDVALESRADAALAAACKRDLSTVRGIYASLGRDSGIVRTLDLNELVQLYVTQDVALLMKRNAALTHDDAVTVYHLVGEYLEGAIRSQRLKRALEALDDYVQTEKAGQVEELPELAESLFQALTTKRAYDVLENPAYLAFEYAAEILLRPNQVAALDTLKIQEGKIGDVRHLGIVLEMIMASGKTTVLLPLLGQLMADGETRPILVMPEALLPSMADRLRTTLQESFEQGIDVIEINRELTTQGSEGVDKLLKRLMNATTDRKVVLMSNSSVQSLYLGFLLSLKEPYKRLVLAKRAHVSPADLYDPHRIATYQKIFSYLQEHASVIVDEVDSVMDVLKSHHYATGWRVPIHPDVLEAEMGIYELFVEQPSLAQLLQLPFLSERGNPPFSEANYAAVLKPAMIEAVLSGQYLPKNTDFQDFMESLHQGSWTAMEEWLDAEFASSSSPSELMIAYLGNSDVTDAAEFINHLANKRIHNILAVLQEQLTTVLPLTANKVLYTHYGPAESHLWAIPYHLGRPTTKSEFGTDLEVLNYTLQMVLERGVTIDVVKREVSRLDTLLANSARREDTFEEIQELFQGLDHTHLKGMTEAEYGALTEAVNLRRDQVLKLTRRHILSRLRTYVEQLDANAQNYGFLFKQVNGFTGTLWNSSTFPRIFGLPVPSDTRERTLYTLWKHSPETVQVVNTHSLKVQDLVDQLYSDAGTTESLIDLAGFFRGIPNKDVATAMLEALSLDNEEIKGVVYYDEASYEMVYLRESKTSLPLASCGLKKEQLLAFWDQPHTTGSDIKLHPSMHAVLTFSRHTILRDLMQGAWRLRGLERGQRVRLAITDVDQDVIIESLMRDCGIAVNGPLNLGHLFQYALSREVFKQADHNLRASWHQMQALPLKEGFGKLIDANLLPLEAIDFYHAIGGLFESNLTDEPYHRYGHMRKLLPSKDVLDDFVERLTADPTVAAIGPVGNYDAQWTQIVAEMLPRLASEVWREQHYQREVSVEQEVEQEQEQEQEREREAEYQRGDEATVDIDWTRQPWARDALFTQAFYTFEGIPEVETVDKAQVYSLHTALELIKYPFGIVFDPLLLTTTNVHRSDWRKIAPFGPGQERYTQVLVVEDKETGQTKVVLLSYFDAQQVENLLIAERRKPGTFPNKQVRLALYHLDSAIKLQGSEPVSEAVFTDAHFRRLILQAKFLRGDISYSKQEAVVLRDWLKEHDPSEMENLFKKDILNWLPTKRKAYSGHALDRIFQGLREMRERSERTAA